MTKLLYIVSSWPGSRAFGGQLRALHIGRALRKIADVTVAVVSSEANDQEARARTESEFTVLPPILPQLSVENSAVQKLRRAFDLRHLNVHGYVAKPEDRARIVSAFKDFDLIWVLNSRTANILQIWEWPRTHLDVDDVPSTYLRSQLRHAPNLRARLRLRIQQSLLHRRETTLRSRFTTLSVCSDDDRRYLGGGDRIHVIPNGYARPATEPARQLQPARPLLGFIGLYSYAPNLDGVRWFLKECWPQIRQAIPGIRFRLAGKDTDGALAPVEPDVDVLGWLADPAAEIATWSAMVIPIRFGGGTRIKLADSFSRKCPVVATPMGAFGYDVAEGRQLRMGETPAEFAQACIDLVRDPQGGAAMAQRAWDDFLQKWTWESIEKKVWFAANDSLQRSRAVAK